MKRSWLPALSFCLAAVAAPIPFAFAKEERTRVEWAVSGEDEPELFETLRELIGRIHLTLRLVSANPGEQGPGPKDLLARVSVESSATELRVIVVDARTGRVALRRNLPRSGAPSVLREEVALVVRSTLDALLEGALTESPRPKPSAASGPARHSAPEPERLSAPMAWGLDVAGLGAVRSFGRGEASLQVGGGGLAELSFGRGGFRPVFRFSTLRYVPVHVRRDGVDVQVGTTSMRLGVAMSPLEQARFRLDVGLGGGADLLDVTSKGPASVATLFPDRTDVLPVVGAYASARLYLGWRASLLLGLSLDVDLGARRYMVSSSEGRDTAVDPARVHVGGVLGLAIHLEGTRDADARTRESP